MRGVLRFAAWALFLVGALFVYDLTLAWTADEEPTWEMAGGPQGFAADNWTSDDPAISMNAFLDRLPDDCAFIVIDRGASYSSVAYHCP